MKKSKWVTDGSLPFQPSDTVPVSVTVIVKTDSNRRSMGYYDFSRSLWYITGIMVNESVVAWQYFPE